jgi:type IV pilus biogenesis protein CpaD/CtpE
MRKTLLIVALSFLLTGCLSQQDGTLSSEPIRPESLLDISSERVSFTLELQDSLDELTEWVNNDQPSRAELYCTNNPDACRETENILNQFGIKFERKSGRDAGDEVVLLYDRIFTRDCAGSDSLGCSVSANTVQMVVDPRQFLDPTLLDLQDAEKAAGVYENYLKNTKK